MAKPFEKHGEKWWRFSKMEVQGNYLQPAEGAKLEWYDPWELHRQRLRGELVGNPLDRLVEICSDRAHPVLPNTDALLSWSQDFGPLGVLLHRTVLVVLPPRREKIARVPLLLTRIANANHTDAEAERKRIGDEETWLVESCRFAGGWYRIGDAPPYGSDPERWLAKHAPGATLRPVWTANNFPDEVGTLAQTWSRYFPSVDPSESETFAYPRPDDPEAFAKLYREPIDEWATWANKIANSVQVLASESFDDRMTGVIVLSTIAAPIRQTLDVRDPARAQLTSRSPALLSSLALMAMQRVGGGERVRVCKDPDCGVHFLPINDRAEYHDNRCRWRHHKAEQRAGKAKKAKRATKKGKRHG